jgi:hypothetical protein
MDHPTTCNPNGPLTPPQHTPTTCYCGATITPVPAGPHDWAWADPNGETRIDTAPAVYAEAQLIRDAITPPAIADTPAWNRYSVLSAQLDLGWINLGHAHTPTHGGSTITPVPWCHDQPMHATPTGWRCRTTKTTTPYTRSSTG